MTFNCEESGIGAMISLEGSDGAGKSTNAKHLVTFLKEKGYEVVTSREPGGTPIGEQLREVLLSSDSSMTLMCEILMLAAVRAQHIEQLIKPAIAAGKIVVCDRFQDSSYAYQGMGRNAVEDVLAVEKLVLK